MSGDSGLQSDLRGLHGQAGLLWSILWLNETVEAFGEKETNSCFRMVNSETVLQIYRPRGLPWGSSEFQETSGIVAGK